MTSRLGLSAREYLPGDGSAALLVGRAWVPAEGGPSVIGARGDDAVDLTRGHATVSCLLNTAGPADVRATFSTAPAVGRLDEIIANSVEGRRDPSRPWLLAPADPQAVTHKVGDVVISARDGTLANEVVPRDEVEPWVFGAGALMANLARRGILHA